MMGVAQEMYPYRWKVTKDYPTLHPYSCVCCFWYTCIYWYVLFFLRLYIIIFNDNCTVNLLSIKLSLSPSVISLIVMMMYVGKGAVVKTSTRQTVFLPIPGLVRASELTPGELVGTNKDSYIILGKWWCNDDDCMGVMLVMWSSDSDEYMTSYCILLTIIHKHYMVIVMRRSRRMNKSLTWSITLSWC